MNFPACSLESAIYPPPTNIPTSGQELMISRQIFIGVPDKLIKDANGLSYSDLCGDVVTTLKPSVTSSDYTPQSQPTGEIAPYQYAPNDQVVLDL